MRRNLELAELQRVDRLEQVPAAPGAALPQPLLAEIEGVVVAAVAENADAHQHLRRLGDVDLDLDRRRGGEIEDLGALVSFDSHLTIAEYSASNGLTRAASFDNLRTVQEHRKRKGVTVFPSPDLLHQLVDDRQQDLLRIRAPPGTPAQPRPQAPCAIAPTYGGPARRGGRRAQLDERRTPRTRLADVRGQWVLRKASISALARAEPATRATPC